MEISLEPSSVVSFAKPAFKEFITKRIRFRHSRILVVVDPGIDLDPGADAFGVERVIRLLRTETVGLWHFHVHVALHSSDPFAVVANPPGTTPKYNGFRFNSVLPSGGLVIDSYDQIWCYGAYGPFTQDDELAALTTWMNNGGGLFATGDHDTLGESLCSRIPRIGTMRAWSNAQGVPPRTGADRIDTNRPFNAAEVAGTEVIEFERQGDTLPQRIDWKAWLSHWHFPWAAHRRPHPVLCHPQLGPINVMPDHPHEGVVFDHVAQPDVGLPAITLGNVYNFNGVTGDEYPTVSGVRPLPLVIAHGRTFAGPPLQHEKGNSPAKRFAMISVYDGHSIGIGRAATDSTWHHWMNINITQLEAAGGANWEKIKRYYLNLALWLAPAQLFVSGFHATLVESFFTYPGIEEYAVKDSRFELGLTLRDHFHRYHGPCWVSLFVLHYLRDYNAEFLKKFTEQYMRETIPGLKRPPRPEPCLSCPSPEAIEVMVLGGVAQMLLQKAFGEGAFEDRVKQLEKLDSDRLSKLIAEGVREGLQEFADIHAADVKRAQQVFAVEK
jgi:hypothetical protein